MLLGDSRNAMADLEDGSVNLIMTSPPFALTRAKSYGNEQEQEYLAWFRTFSGEFSRILAEDGSLVIDLGGTWLPGSPSKSLYQYRLLIELCDDFGFHLAQDFYWFNRAKMPGPAQWVTRERTRLKDSVHNIWWLVKNPSLAKADNRRVLKPYSKSMLRMIRTGKYNSGPRPSEHKVGLNWAKDLGGAIAPNVIETDYDEDRLDPLTFPDSDNMLDTTNTSASDDYNVFCRINELTQHPARFPPEVPDFFVRYLTDPGDLVLDPFGGSNVVGAAAELYDRKWLACEIREEYIAGSLGRFERDKIVIENPAFDAGARWEHFDMLEAHRVERKRRGAPASPEETPALHLPTL